MTPTATAARRFGVPGMPSTCAETRRTAVPPSSCQSVENTDAESRLPAAAGTESHENEYARAAPHFAPAGCEHRLIDGLAYPRRAPAGPPRLHVAQVLVGLLGAELAHALDDTNLSRRRDLARGAKEDLVEAAGHHVEPEGCRSCSRTSRIRRVAELPIEAAAASITWWSSARTGLGSLRGLERAEAARRDAAYARRRDPRGPARSAPRPRGPRS